jgi:hypothetical protein
MRSFYTYARERFFRSLNTLPRRQLGLRRAVLVRESEFLIFGD